MECLKFFSLYVIMECISLGLLLFDFSVEYSVLRSLLLKVPLFKILTKRIHYFFRSPIRKFFGIINKMGHGH